MSGAVLGSNFVFKFFFSYWFILSLVEAGRTRALCDWTLLIAALRTGILPALVQDLALIVSNDSAVASLALILRRRSAYELLLSSSSGRRRDWEFDLPCLSSSSFSPTTGRPCVTD